MSVFEQFADMQDRVGESPLWDERAQAWLWVDIESRCIRRAASGDSVQSWALPERVGCIALMPDGRVMAAMETGIAAVTLLGDGAVALDMLAHIQHPVEGMRFNDGRCDASGRFWVGTMVMDMGKASPLGGLYCLDERGLTGPHVTGLLTPNGLGFSPDGRTLYLSDSHPAVQKIWAFDLNLASGALSSRRLFVDMQPLPGRPDGAAVDTQGHYWICGNDAGQIHRFSPQGQLERSLQVPMPKPAMCAFGGTGLDQLLVTSIIPAQRATDDTHSGTVVLLRPGFTGLPEPVFSRFPQTA